ncbi:uncharacterized protein A4U43_C05F17610 [Asparagus officinalis]|uniref:Uncharacterized protein n=1 Tax=Asparagus officinalis TaxID=4686 RepID=A0A5P1EW80_ASPOF|nr:uncharacterized protein A4U43_C05F17610 [Asparagus officinalis]
MLMVPDHALTTRRWRRKKKLRFWEWEREVMGFVGFTMAGKGLDEGKKVEGEGLNLKRRKKKLGFWEVERGLMGFRGIHNGDSQEPRGGRVGRR